MIYESGIKPLMDKIGPQVDKFIDDVGKDGFGAVTKLVNEIQTNFTKGKTAESNTSDTAENLKRRLVKQGIDDKKSQ